MKFHITIKNNETGEILHDQDCNAIIGGICDNEKNTSVVLTQCNGKDLVFCALPAKKAIDKAVPEQLRAFYTVLGMIGDMEDATDKEDK